MDWNWFDYAVFGTLLLGAWLAYKLVTSWLNPKYRVVTAFVIVAAVLLIWAELAVGVFGSPFAGS
jgi:hypothetical protein